MEVPRAAASSFLGTIISMNLDADTLRAIPSLTGAAPDLNVSALPDDPATLFGEWLEQALAADVAEPTSVTMSTIGTDEVPDSRMLRLKSVDERGWAFASTAGSVKGRQLAATSAAALTFWWQPQVRAVRVRGPVVEGSREENLADLAARSQAARDGVAAEEWRLWFVQPTTVEFWQGAQDRNHHRIIYTRAAEGSEGSGWEISVNR